ncbi:MAG TPA: hypothetical protein VGJ84_15975 [Polyangiaceae bacterium]|jgi:6-phospho-beta-glucosidase
MHDNLTLCIVGAGSSYSPELIEGILQRSHQELPVARIQLTDIDAARLGIMAGLTRRMVHHAERAIEVTEDVRLDPMLDGADFVVTQIRVGGTRARHLDETIPLKYGIVGQETTGPGGMFKALRTIPEMVEIGRAVARRAPSATILNYTNPSGIITEAVCRYSDAKLVGLCSGIPGVQESLREKLRGPFPSLSMYSVGLNHLGFIYRFVTDGQDVTQKAIEHLLEQEPDSEWLKAARILGAVPMPGYTSMFFNRKRRVEDAQRREQTRAQQVEEIEKKVFAEAADPNTVTKPPSLSLRGGGGYSDITFSVLRAILRDTGEELVMSTMNRGAVDGLPDDVAVELTCKVDASGAHPVRVGPLPTAFRGLVQTVKAYESLTVDAAMRRDKKLALQALLNHPLVGDLDTAQPLLDDLLQAHGLDFH